MVSRGITNYLISKRLIPENELFSDIPVVQSPGSCIPGQRVQGQSLHQLPAAAGHPTWHPQPSLYLSHTSSCAVERGRAGDATTVKSGRYEEPAQPPGAMERSGLLPSAMSESCDLLQPRCVLMSVRHVATKGI